MTALTTFFSANGGLAKAVRGYLPRQAQLEMAQAIEAAIQSKQNLIAEAGTGTGKTFAYLVPAILSGKKVIVSTGTKNLQDQLVTNDLPILRKAINQPFAIAVLKGRNNYLCTYRLENALASTLGFTREDAQALAKIKQWVKKTTTGDRTEMAGVPESDPIWYQATSTTENCLGSDCDDYDECFLVKARKKAQESEIIVVNHHLLCADWSLRDGGYMELLPKADVVIIDEAHQLADTASNFLGISISAKQLQDLADDALSSYFKEASDNPALRPASEALSQGIKELRLAFGEELKRGSWREVENTPFTVKTLNDTALQLQALAQQLKVVSVKSKDLELLNKRAENMNDAFDTLLKDTSDKWIRWYETHKKSFTLHRTPLQISTEFRSFMQAHTAATWIFTSATLSVANNFTHFAANLGLHEATSLSWPSPFDYQSQALFYHPKGLPQPSEADFTAKIVEFALPVLRASKGHAFFLFTSHRALQQAAVLLEKSLDYPLLIQGSRPKALLLEQFKKTKHAVLLGTASFWEGVDVRGEALSCVIIDKLPFASPDDPVLKARLDALTQQGKNAFMYQQVPSAVISLRQGVGRLIRDVTDRGVLMICDPRLLKAAYGQLFLDSLPPMRRSRDITEVQAFFAQEK